jgi:hypothetical protein
MKKVVIKSKKDGEIIHVSGGINCRDLSGVRMTEQHYIDQAWDDAMEDRIVEPHWMTVEVVDS